MDSADSLPPISNFTRDGSDGYIAETEFYKILNGYLDNLNACKREKALMKRSMYNNIYYILKNPNKSNIDTAQFRFWCKKMFKLSIVNHVEVVTHEDRPLACKDQIYDILVQCHAQCNHGGRDKTSTVVRSFYAWIPKELIARFVKACPTCSNKRSGKPIYPQLPVVAKSSVSLPASEDISPTNSQFDDSSYQAAYTLSYPAHSYGAPPAQSTSSYIDSLMVPSYSSQSLYSGASSDGYLPNPPHSAPPYTNMGGLDLSSYNLDLTAYDLPPLPASAGLLSSYPSASLASNYVIYQPTNSVLPSASQADLTVPFIDNSYYGLPTPSSCYYDLPENDVTQYMGNIGDTYGDYLNSLDLLAFGTGVDYNTLVPSCAGIETQYTTEANCA